MHSIAEKKLLKSKFSLKNSCSPVFLNTFSPLVTKKLRCAVEFVANYTHVMLRKKKYGSSAISEFDCSRTVARAEKPSFLLKSHPFTA